MTIGLRGYNRNSGHVSAVSASSVLMHFEEAAPAAADNRGRVRKHSPKKVNRSSAKYCSARNMQALLWIPSLPDTSAAVRHEDYTLHFHRCDGEDVPRVHNTGIAELILDTQDGKA